MEYQGVTYPDVKLPCNRENMTKLVEALESGDFEQGQQALLTITEDGKRKHCCLGVASEISGLGFWDDDPEEPRYVVGHAASSAVLLRPVENWLGIEDSQMILSGPNDLGEVVHADGLNDADGEEYPDTYDFKAIATRIRQVYLTD